MTRLSVNINKIATLRNARGGNMPDLLLFAKNAERYGAQGITVHPRPDERHIKYKDVYDLKPVLTTEFNIEGYPSRDFIDLILKVKPAQVTLVPDPPDAITSNAGWDTKKHQQFLTEIIAEFKNAGIRTSVFVDTELQNIEYAAKCGTSRVELYTENYARQFHIDKNTAITPYKVAAKMAHSVGLEINAGHDLNLDNLKYFSDNIEHLKEVSIGHALISDALYYGIENTIQLYLRQLV